MRLLCFREGDSHRRSDTAALKNFSDESSRNAPINALPFAAIG